MAITETHIKKGKEIMDIELENKYLKHETLSLKADLIMAQDRIKYLEHEVDTLTKEIDKYGKATFGDK